MEAGGVGPLVASLRQWNGKGRTPPATIGVIEPEGSHPSCHHRRHRAGRVGALGRAVAVGGRSRRRRRRRRRHGHDAL